MRIVKKKQSKYTRVEIFFDTGWEWNDDWVKNPSHVECQKIGVADKSIEKGVVLASFNAG